MSRLFFIISAICSLASCGVSYTSPSVQEVTGEGGSVEIVSLDAQAIALANKAPYVSRQLPSELFAVARGGTLRALGALPEAPDSPDARPERVSLSLPPLEPASAYKIGVGDVLLLSTQGEESTVEQLSGLLAAQNRRQGYTVRDDGTITIPSIGDIRLADLSLREAQDVLFQVLVENQIDPSLSLEVSEFNSQRVTVGGAVGATRNVPITLNPLTLGEALTSAGGVQVPDEEFAVIRLYRDQKLYQIPFDTYLARPELRETRLQDRDALYVDTTYDLDRAFTFFQKELDVIALRNTARTTALDALQREVSLQREALQERRNNFQLRVELDAVERDYVYLAGEVSQKARVALPFERQATLADVLFDEGGFDTTTADASQIYVLRSSKAAANVDVTAYHLDAANAANLVLATRMLMRPNDIVFIEEQVITQWTRSLQTIFPALLTRAAAN